MGFYEAHVLPRITDRALRGGDFARLRARAAAGLAGDVLEVGFGSGLNVPHYPSAVKRVLAVDPATLGRKLAARRLAASPVRASYIGADARALPLPDASIGQALSTWTLCTIPDVERALAELRRVLRPGGTLHFTEHGRSPDPKVARTQDRFTPLQRRLAGGCHLNRPIGQLLAAAGFELSRLDTFYMAGPRAWGYTFAGVAVRPAKGAGA
ncbi:MAG: class I SAM-dependent methyltransferase [Actinobacteria bacterium]|nr:class I SAM-dependent methyltransferase [Actinomycetota bacterium]